MTPSVASTRTPVGSPVNGSDSRKTASENGSGIGCASIPDANRITERPSQPRRGAECFCRALCSASRLNGGADPGSWSSHGRRHRARTETLPPCHANHLPELSEVAERGSRRRGVLHVLRAQPSDSRRPLYRRRPVPPGDTSDAATLRPTTPPATPRPDRAADSRRLPARAAPRRRRHGHGYEAEDAGHRPAGRGQAAVGRLAASPASVERFRQEGRLASQLTHPRCVFVLRGRHRRRPAVHRHGADARRHAQGPGRPARPAARRARPSPASST